MEDSVDLGETEAERPNRRRLLTRVIVAATVAVLCTLGLSVVTGQAARAAGAPTVTSLGAGSGIDIGGTTVNIFGTGFTSATEVDFDTTSASFTVVSDTQIKAISPAHADGTVDITVTTPDGTSAVTPADQFTFLREMRITSISPTAGPVAGGGTMTITGTGFTGTSLVIFSESVNFQSHTTRASFTVDSDTQITATIPPAPAGVAGKAGILVVGPVTPDPTVSVPFYNYVTTPTVTGVSPNFGLVSGGTTVGVTGTGFVSGTTVQFGSTPATSVTVLSTTSLSVVSPPGSTGIADITVTTPFGTSAVSLRDQFTYIPLPAVTGVSPSSGPVAGGNNVVITGTDFLLPDGSLAVSEVDFGSVPARGFAYSNSSTQITASVPAGVAGTVDVTVKTLEGTTTVTPADQYTYFPVPAVTGVSPSSGPIVGGNTVTVTGTGFTGASAVSFDTVPATSFTVNSDTSVTATVPAGVVGPVSVVGTIDDVTVTTPGGTSATSTADQYTYEPVPTVTGVSPGSGPIVGGNTVTVTGAGFTGGTGFITASAVFFGTVPATSFTVNNDGSITATVPAGVVGIVDVTVTTTGGTSPVSAADQYAYAPVPTVTGVSPGSGLSVGGNTVTVTGTGLTGASAVSFGTVPATGFTVNSDTSITATVPAGAVGIVDVTVTTPGGTSVVSAADQYIYHPTCTTTITGNHSTPITVSSGLTCLVNATQAGQVTVAPGAALSVTGSTISGSVTATDPAGITYCGSTESGRLTITGATGPVVLGGTLPDGACAADTISGAVTVTGASAPVTVTGLRQAGALTLENDTAGVDLEGGQINGQINVSDNTATAPAAIAVAGVVATGSLYCTGNNPPPTDNGSINTVSGTATDQCAGIAQR
jgi:IPT/TIG domain